MGLEDKHDDSMESIAASQPSQVSSGEAPLAKRPALADATEAVSPVGSKVVFHLAQELEP